MNESEEFARIRAAIESATEVLAGAIEKHGAGSWDYVIVAVPHARKTTRVAIMSSLMPEMVPLFLEYLLAQYRASKTKSVEINGVPLNVKPS